jgi:hypothetical protein
MFQALKCLKHEAEQKSHFLLCGLKKSGMDFFSILQAQTSVGLSVAAFYTLVHRLLAQEFPGCQR